MQKKIFFFLDKVKIISTVGAFYYRKKIFFNTIKSSPVTTFAVIRSPYFNESAYLFFVISVGASVQGLGGYSFLVI